LISGGFCLAREIIICAGRSAASANVASLVGQAIYVQIEVASGCGSDLGWATSARGLDLRLTDPHQARELYRYAWLIGRLPVRVSIPSTASVAFAVRISVALGMAVKLAFPPHAAYAWSELDDVLDFYLHGRLVDQPIEPYHSLLQAALDHRRDNIWCIQDEDPASVRFLSGQGESTLPSRFANQPDVRLDKRFVARWRSVATSPGSACRDCSFQRDCGGYFLWPDTSPTCEAKAVWTRIVQAARQLTVDLQGEGASPA
jgi:hypothetical protein